MANSFLENLKKDLDNGEFNSETAKKINEIGKLADKKEGATPALNKIYDDIDSGKIEVKKGTEEEIIIANSEYEKALEDIRKRDVINQQIAVLIEFQDVTKTAITEMLSFTDELSKTFENELASDNPMFNDLKLKIAEIKNVYEPTLAEYKHKE